jgi:hypothetical protein
VTRGWKPIRRTQCNRVGSVGYADCIPVLLGRFRSGHAVQSRTHKCCQVNLTEEWGASGQIHSGQTAKRDNTELLTIQTSRTAAKLQLKASVLGYPHLAIVIGCCMSQWRSRFIRKGMNYSFPKRNFSHGVFVVLNWGSKTGELNVIISHKQFLFSK